MIEAVLAQFEQRLVEFDRVDRINSLSIRPFENIKVRLAPGATTAVSVFKVVDAFNQADADRQFAQIQVDHQYDGSHLRISELRTGGGRAPPGVNRAYTRIVVSAPSPLALNFLGGACEIDVAAPTGPANIKAKAGAITMSAPSDDSSLVLDAGKIALNTALGRGSHFVEMKAGEVSFAESAQTNLIWRVSTGLGTILRSTTSEPLPNPYTGMAGPGATRLTLHVEVGNIGVR